MTSQRISRRRFAQGVAACSLLGHTSLMAHAPRSNYRIESIDLFVRVTPPGRLAVAIGRNKGPKPQPERNPIAHVRMIVSDRAGNRTFGCSGDRMSVRWLDKRPGRDKERKLRELVSLIETARDTWLEQPDFDSPFTQWHSCHRRIQEAGRTADQEDLTSAFASSLMERAMLDAVCRLAGRSIFEMVHDNQIGFAPGEVLPELAGFQLHQHLPPKPLTRIHARHTVGKVDPLRLAEIDPEDRLEDGLPQALEEYVRINGHKRFKLKASGDLEFDLKRMKAIWQVLPHEKDTLLTVDANEAYHDLSQFEQFVDRLQAEQPEFFARLGYIEQPLPRGLTLDPTTSESIQRIRAKKPLIIDEADGTLTAFSEARKIGYSGCSHKNCKGLFKSLLNLSLVKKHADENLFLSGEDLQNMPLVPLHQDFAAVALLGLEHCERNGHHFNYGLCMVSDGERELAARYHGDMYERRDSELFLKIRNGAVELASLQCPGFGIRFEPEWDTMQPMQAWLREQSGSR